MTRTPPHWIVMLDAGQVVDSGYCYCPTPEAPPFEHDVHTGIPLDGAR